MTKRFIKIFLLLSILFTVHLNFPLYGASESYKISNMVIDMEVHSDNSYEITETLTVNFLEERHGIIRNIPRKTNKGANVDIVDIDVNGAPYTIESDKDWLNIRIGDPNNTVIGQQVYTIRYTYDIGDDGSFNKDELYFNLVGSDFNCTIEKVKFTIEMPFTFDENKINFTHGVYGSTDNSDVFYSVNQQTISGYMKTSLAPYEALTIALPLPQGYYEDAPSPSILPYFIAFIPAILLGLGIVLWIKKGRKQQAFPTVEFYPPQDTTSADVGFLIDGHTDPADVTSLLVYWADRGYLTIREESVKKFIRKNKIFWFTKIKEAGPEMRPHERDFFTELFSYGDGTTVNTNQLKNCFFASVKTIQNKVERSYEDQEETRIFAQSNHVTQRLLQILAFLSLLPFHLLILYRYIRTIDIELFVGAVVITGLGILILNQMFQTIKKRNHQSVRKNLKDLFISTILFLVIIVVEFIMAKRNGFFIPMLPALLSAIVLAFLTTKCTRRTKLGLWYKEKLIGFRDFIKATELDRIKMLIEENPNYFYNILPYAMALNVTQQWAKGFEHIAIEPPNWYYGASFTTFNAYYFANELQSNMDEISETLTSSPSNSSYGSGGADSSSGGSSGGGSGGGGASDW